MPNDIVTGKTSSEIENLEWSTGTTFGNVIRFGSSQSSGASQSSGDICRICHCESDPQNPLLTPCYCSGSLKYVHQACLQQWLTASETNACELCKFPFIMHTKIKPFNEWRSLDMSGVERRRLCCAVLFHCAAALCVIWSLCVLIERAAEEVKRGLIGWPFWTKLAVVTVGLAGGIVFMYIQCKQYLHLCHRWRARNRILLIQNAPEKIHRFSPPSPIVARSNIIHNSCTPVESGISAAVYNYNNYGNALATNSSNSVTASQINHPNIPIHGQIIANIENTSQNYERDWTLDDVSQISSFRPYPQGSGSMTPFHDSTHNVLEISQCSSNSNNDSNNLDLFKLQKTNDKEHKVQYPNSSIFFENRDILNDIKYPKINHRHSSVLMSPEVTDNLGKFLCKDVRRYSDTKLLQYDTDVLSPIFRLSLSNDFKENRRQTFLQKQRKQIDIEKGSYNRNILGCSQITDIIFENTNQFDPLDLNIQDILEFDFKQIHGKKSRHSLNATKKTNEHIDGLDRSRIFFKSLPNLSNSCESLIKK